MEQGTQADTKWAYPQKGSADCRTVKSQVRETMSSDAEDSLIWSLMPRAENWFQPEGGSLGDTFVALLRRLLTKLKTTSQCWGMTGTLWKQQGTWAMHSGSFQFRYKQDGWCLSKVGPWLSILRRRSCPAPQERHGEGRGTEGGRAVPALPGQGPTEHGWSSYRDLHRVASLLFVLN